MDFFELYLVVNKTISSLRKLNCPACLNCCGCMKNLEHNCVSLSRRDLFKKSINILALEGKISVPVYQALLVINGPEADRGQQNQKPDK